MIVYIEFGHIVFIIFIHVIHEAKLVERQNVVRLQTSRLILRLNFNVMFSRKSRNLVTVFKGSERAEVEIDDDDIVRDGKQESAAEGLYETNVGSTVEKCVGYGNGQHALQTACLTHGVVVFKKGSIFNPKTIDILTLKLHFNKNNE